ncbi:HTH-type transcriptional regulator CdhR [Baekduia alba]|nr:DJ-1/PfpI family protein [Baekduia alba]WCB91707.1 HTH-type transcriptional regulator CdhR [Baekduia alba]
MRVVIVALDGAQSLDVLGPVEVLQGASALAGPGGAYEVSVVAPSGGGTITLSNGLALSCGALPDPRRGAPIDTIIFAGGDGTRALSSEHPAVAWLRRAAPRARRVASVCTGALALAHAGLLDGRRATTHWAYCAALARAFPAVEVDPDPIYVRDGDIWTSAGVTAGMDLTLALVEDDLGSEVALEVARWLVLFLKRPGGQAQFSAGLAAQTAVREPLRELQAWMNDNLTADLSIAALAARACLSERQFARAWRAETGVTPAAYVEGLRVERARTLLEGGAAVDGAARGAGFGSAEVLRRVFHRRLGVGPAAYRERFCNNIDNEGQELVVSA